MEEYHDGHISDPMVSDGYFSVNMKMDATFKDKGRQKMDELCLYKVENGKITETNYFYNQE
ncbi:SnoaL-like domain-containing protein [Gangjinia marincola]